MNEPQDLSEVGLNSETSYPAWYAGDWPQRLFQVTLGTGLGHCPKVNENSFGQDGLSLTIVKESQYKARSGTFPQIFQRMFGGLSWKSQMKLLLNTSF